MVDVVTLPDWLANAVEEDAPLLGVGSVNELEDALEDGLVPEADEPVAEMDVVRLLEGSADLLEDAVFSSMDWLGVVEPVRPLASLAGEIQLPEDVETSEME